MHGPLDIGFAPVSHEANLALVQAGRRLLRERGAADRPRPCRRDVFRDDADEVDAVLVG